MKSWLGKIFGIPVKPDVPQEVGKPLKRRCLLNQYELLGEIGRGGFGIVYKARDVHLAQLVAIKELALENPELLRDEAAILSELRHENIVGFRQLFPEDGHWYLVMDYIDGASLSAAIERRSLYALDADATIQRIVQLGIQTSTGLAFAHRKGIVHRDVKPSNILIAKDNVTKVTDFGLAKAGTTHQRHVLGDKASNILLSQGGMTPAYCSPEQAQHRAVTAKTDVWSWGLLMLEIFIGEMCWSYGTAAPHVLAEYLDAGPRIKEIPPMPVGLVNLLTQCFTAEVAKRPSMERLPTTLMSLDLHQRVSFKQNVKDELKANVRQESRPTPGEENYLAAMRLAAKAQWDRAFLELRTACNVRYAEALAMLKIMWCPHCRRIITEPTTTAVSEYSAFWNGRCPRCKSQMHFGKQNYVN